MSDAGMPPTGPIALVSAMPEELHTLLPALEGAGRTHLGGRTFHHGRLAGRPVVLVLSGIGKVAAATTATLLAGPLQAQALLFTGVAGGLAPQVQVGDIVVAEALLQHDLDVSPLFPRWVVPSSGRSHFATDARWRARLAASARSALPELAPRLAPHRPAGGRSAEVHEGLVISGDRFVSTRAESEALRAVLPDALAVEMEGAAVAQVCADFGLPFAMMRLVSDRADDSAHVDFARFVADVASEASQAVLRHALAAD